jgi:uncharacterized repeat protein (TIGR04138 family)
MTTPALDWKSVYAAMHRAGEATFPPAALYYVLQTVRKRAAVPQARLPLTPEDIITTFRAGVRREFGPLFREVLEDWNLRAPADLGEAVLLLGRYRCLALEPSDTREAFAADGRAFYEEPAA